MTRESNTARAQIICRSLLIWLVIIVAEIVHGILRGLLLVGLVGQFHANQIGVFSGSAIILVIACASLGWIGGRQTADLLLTGLIWLLLTVAFEVLFGRFVIGLTWEQILSDYNLMQGGLMPIGLLALFFSPLIAAKILASR
jgi:hypothetical protein